MKQLTRTFPLLLAAALQLLPLLKNLVTSPAAGSSFAIILRWGIATGAALDAVDAVSGATNGFAGGTNLTLTVNAPFTTNLVLSAKTSGDGGAFCYITNLAPFSVTSIQNGQTTTNAMPVGLTIKFTDVNSGSASFTNVFCQIYGTPTQIGTNAFNIGLYYPSATEIVGFFKIAVIAGAGSPPTITNQPVASITNLVGTTNTSISVIAGGTAPLSYQWYFNTNTAVLNQTNATLTLNNIQLTNAGYYRCTITNSVGSTNSANALLTVWQPPIITNQPVSITNNVGTTASFSVTAGGTPAPAYQWFYNTNTILVGQTAATLTLNNLQLTNAGYYRCTITNSAGSTNSANALLTVWQPPVITNQPASFTTVAGGSATFSVTAGGTPAPGFQWKLNTNTVLAGATGATLSLANVRVSQAGIYSVTVTNSAGGTNSAYVNLVVTNPPPPNLNGLVNASSGGFNFTFAPVIGLTNTILTNGDLAGGTWGVFTNIPPPATATPITLTNQPAIPNLFYKVLIQP